MFLLCELESALAALDVHCQLDCIQVGLVTSLRSERPIERFLHPLREVLADVSGEVFGRSLLLRPTLPASRAADLAGVEELERADLAILGPEELTLCLIVDGGLCPHLDKPFKRPDLDVSQADFVVVIFVGFALEPDKLVGRHGGSIANRQPL